MSLNGGLDGMKFIPNTFNAKGILSMSINQT